MRLIDVDRLLKGYEDHDFIDTHIIWNAPTVETIPTDWIITYIKAKLDKVADMVKADGNEHEMGMEIVEATAINKMLTDWAERKEE